MFAGDNFTVPGRLYASASFAKFFACFTASMMLFSTDKATYIVGCCSGTVQALVLLQKSISMPTWMLHGVI